MSNRLLSTVAVSALAIAAVGGAAFADSAAPSGATSPRPQNTVATATPIKHLVMIFNENVSFDHYFATYPKATNPSGRTALSRPRRRHAFGE